MLTVVSISIPIAIRTAIISADSRHTKRVCVTESGCNSAQSTWVTLLDRRGATCGTCAEMLPPYPEHYRNRVAQIQAELENDPPQGRTVVLLGDSLTEAHPAKQLAGMRVMNMGISGDEARHSSGGIMRRIQLAADAKPAHVFLLIGINDLIASQKPTDAISADQAELIMKLVRLIPTATIHAQSVPPVRDTYQKYNDAVRTLNVALRTSAMKLGARNMDLYSLMADDDGRLKQEYSADGLHLTPAAYAVWTQELDKRLKMGK